MRPDDLSDFSAFMREFQDETDRGAALVGAAMLDHRLAETLRAFFVQGRTAIELLDGGTAPLGTLSSRIKAAHALGLIDDFEMAECDVVRKIRNEFAHGLHGLTFSAEKIVGLCARLRSDLPGGREAFVGRPRGVFINAVILTALRLTYRSEWVARERRTSRRWP